MARDLSLGSWVTVAEAAKMLDCSTNNIHQLLLRGKLEHAIKRGHTILIPKQDVAARQAELSDRERERRRKIAESVKGQRARAQARFDREFAEEITNTEEQ